MTIFMAPISDRGFSSALSSPFPWPPLLPGPSLGSPWALGLFFPWALGSGAVITKTATAKIDTAAKKTIQQLQKKVAVAEAQPMQQLKKKDSSIYSNSGWYYSAYRALGPISFLAPLLPKKPMKQLNKK